MKLLLKAIIDQQFHAPRIARRLLKDENFTAKCRLLGMHPIMGHKLLTPNVGFVISMYESAKHAFRALSALTDEHIFAEIVLRRLQGLTSIYDPRKHTFHVIGRALADVPDWQILGRDHQFYFICRSLYCEELRGVLNMDITYPEAGQMFDELYRGVSRYRQLTLQ